MIFATCKARRWFWLLLVALAVCLADQVAKILVLEYLAPGVRVSLPLGFHFTNTSNFGIGFGLFSGVGSWLIIMVVICMVSLLLLYFAQNYTLPLLWLPVGLIVGGAVGNLIDRIGRQAVVDFIELGWWPTFNVGDVAITLGVIGLIYELFFQRQRPAGS